jgi:hypothetical protein
MIFPFDTLEMENHTNLKNNKIYQKISLLGDFLERGSANMLGDKFDKNYDSFSA